MNKVITNSPERKFDEKLGRDILKFSAFPEMEPENIFWIETESAPMAGSELIDMQIEAAKKEQIKTGKFEFKDDLKYN